MKDWTSPKAYENKLFTRVKYFMYVFTIWPPPRIPYNPRPYFIITGNFPNVLQETSLSDVGVGELTANGLGAERLTVIPATVSWSCVRDMITQAGITERLC